MYLFELEYSSFLDICPGVELLDHVATLFLVLFFFLIYLFLFYFIFGCVGSSFLCEGFL